MGITSALVLFFVIWFLVFLIALPIRLETQGDVGEVEPGTHAGAPTNPKLKKKAWITTGISAPPIGIINKNPIKNGGAYRDRTGDLNAASVALSQLS